MVDTVSAQHFSCYLYKSMFYRLTFALQYYTLCYFSNTREVKILVNGYFSSFVIGYGYHLTAAHIASLFTQHIWSSGFFSHLFDGGLELTAR